MKTITNATLYSYTGEIADKNVTIDRNSVGDFILHGRMYPEADFEIIPNGLNVTMKHIAGGWTLRYVRASRR